jgi:hypothetical protein
MPPISERHAAVAARAPTFLALAFCKLPSGGFPTDGTGGLQIDDIAMLSAGIVVVDDAPGGPSCDDQGRRELRLEQPLSALPGRSCRHDTDLPSADADHSTPEFPISRGTASAAGTA